MPAEFLSGYEAWTNHGVYILGSIRGYWGGYEGSIPGAILVHEEVDYPVEDVGIGVRPGGYGLCIETIVLKIL